jgi:hypothetical protein
MSIIYTDRCCDESVKLIEQSLNLNVIQRIEQDKWTVNDALSIITLPNLKLAVINVIDELSVMEMALLHFMCKPILVTSDTIKNYPMIKEKVIDYVDLDSDLRKPDNQFINWFRRKWESR